MPAQTKALLEKENEAFKRRIAELEKQLSASDQPDEGIERTLTRKP